MAGDYLEDYRTDGFAVVRGVFSAAEVVELAEAFDAIHAQALSHPATFRHGNTLFALADDANVGRIVRMVQWPSYFDAVMARYRTHRRMLEVVEPLIGRDLKQIINQMHWKPPGAAMAEFGYHQDIRFRRPRDAYRDPGVSYVQTGIAVDPHRHETGAMTFSPGSHRLGELNVTGAGRVMNTPISDDDLRRSGLDPAANVDLELDPGDVALWHLYAVHGSGPNVGSGDRRLYINGYVKADKCDRGEWAFRGGQPCSLGEPVLVHYEDLFERPEPHYVE